jgi:predicted Rossmann fold nucleotide-binding protein DprA/Smf involved in DNA uptake
MEDKGKTLEKDSDNDKNEIKNKKSSTKDELINNIREWIKIDNDLLNLKKELKNKTTQKKLFTDNLVKVMKENAIDCFDVAGGALVYKQKKSKKPISGKFLLLQLEKYYKEQPDLAKEITQHVLDNREEQVKEEIMRKVKK